MSVIAWYKIVNREASGLGVLKILKFFRWFWYAPIVKNRTLKEEQNIFTFSWVPCLSVCVCVCVCVYVFEERRCGGGSNLCFWLFLEGSFERHWFLEQAEFINVFTHPLKMWIRHILHEIFSDSPEQTWSFFSFDPTLPGTNMYSGSHNSEW